MREEAVESVLAVSHVEVNAGIEASFNMEFAALLAVLSVGALALADCEVLVGAKGLNILKFCFEPFIFQKFLVVHLLNYILIVANKIRA